MMLRMAGGTEQEVADLYKLRTGTGKLTEQESLRLQEYAAKTKTGWEQMLQQEDLRTDRNSQALYNIFNQLEAKTGEDYRKMGLIGAEAEMRRRSGQVPTPAQAQAAKDAGAGSEFFAKLAQSVDTISSVLKNALGGAAIAAALGLGGVFTSGLAAASALNKVAAAGGMGGPVGPGGPGGGWKGAARTIGRMGLGLGVGLAADWLGDKAAGAIGGTTGNVIGGAISGAGAGLGLGLMTKNPWLMAGGALAGAALGGYGAYTSGPGSTPGADGVNMEALGTESMRGITASTLTVTDKEATMTLQRIAAYMAESVELLRGMQTPGATKTTRAGTEIPSTASYLSGNGAPA
jgi:hypothetical protein